MNKDAPNHAVLPLQSCDNTPKGCYTHANSQAPAPTNISAVPATPLIKGAAFTKGMGLAVDLGVDLDVLLPPAPVPVGLPPEMVAVALAVALVTVAFAEAVESPVVSPSNIPVGKTLARSAEPMLTT